MVLTIENGEEDQSGCADDGGDSGAHGVDLLPVRSVWREFCRMSQPALKDESKVESHHGDNRHGYEHWFQVVRTNVFTILV